MNDALQIEVCLSPRPSDSDLLVMAEIERECYPPRSRYSRATIRRFLAWEGSLLVRAHCGGELAGFQIGNVVSGQLITLDVRPQWRRRGVGSAILRTTLDEMNNRGLPYAQCEIAVDNAASIELHLKFGFQAIGRIPGYYENGADALLMLLLFPGASRIPAR